MLSSMVPMVVSNVLFAAALALIAIVVTRYWRSPQLAHALWALVLVKLITPPVTVYSIPDDWLDGFAGQVESAAVEVSPEDDNVVSLVETPPLTIAAGDLTDAGTAAESVQSELTREAIAPPVAPAPEVAEASDSEAPWTSFLTSLRSNWAMIVLSICSLGAVVYALASLRRIYQFKRVLAASAVASDDITSAAARLAEEMGLRHCPPIRVVEATIPPLVWSLGIRPLVLLPSGLLEGLDERQREAVIAHELAHVRRRDNLVRWLEIVTLFFYWWNPLAWFARHKLREAEEECCDAWVVWALPNERRSYGEAMLKTIEFLTDRPAIPVFAGSSVGSAFYKRRIEMILKQHVSRRMSWTAFALVAAIAVCILPAAAQTGTTVTEADFPGEEHTELPGEDETTRQFGVGLGDPKPTNPGAIAPRQSAEERKLLREIGAAQNAHSADAAKLKALKTEDASREELLKQELKSARSQLRVERLISSLLRLRNQYTTRSKSTSPSGLVTRGQQQGADQQAPADPGDDYGSRFPGKESSDSQKPAKTKVLPSQGSQFVDGIPKSEYEIVRLIQNPNSGTGVTFVSVWAQEPENVKALKEWLAVHPDAMPDDIALWLNQWRAGIFSVDRIGPVNLGVVRETTPAGAEQLADGPFAIVFEDREMTMVREFGQPWTVQLPETQEGNPFLAILQPLTTPLDLDVEAVKTKYWTQKKKRYAMMKKFDEMQDLEHEGKITDVQLDEFEIDLKGQEVKVAQAELELKRAQLQKERAQLQQKLKTNSRDAKSVEQHEQAVHDLADDVVKAAVAVNSSERGKLLAIRKLRDKLKDRAREGSVSESGLIDIEQLEEGQSARVEQAKLEIKRAKLQRQEIDQQPGANGAPSN